MISAIAKCIDWSVLQAEYAITRGSAKVLRTDSPFDRHFARTGASLPESKWRLAEALEFLNGPDFVRAHSDLAQIEFDGPRNFKFPTPRPGKVEENNIVYGRLYRCAERWQERPVIVLLDGSPAVGYHSAFPLLARRFNRAGFNVATLVAPYHLQRRPRRPFEENYLEFARAMAQNVAEIRALTGWLLDEGCPSVGLVGFSFGGWLVGLTACSDARIACAVLTLPAVRSRCSPPIFWRRARETLQAL
ncbi:MAG TPA: alpha/beta hydrolase family protein, partial [Pirellulales bacterium]